MASTEPNLFDEKLHDPYHFLAHDSTTSWQELQRFVDHDLLEELQCEDALFRSFRATRSIPQAVHLRNDNDELTKMRHEIEFDFYVSTNLASAVIIVCEAMNKAQSAKVHMSRILHDACVYANRAQASGAWAVDRVAFQRIQNGDVRRLVEADGLVDAALVTTAEEILVYAGIAGERIAERAARTGLGVAVGEQLLETSLARPVKYALRDHGAHHAWAGRVVKRVRLKPYLVEGLLGHEAFMIVSLGRKKDDGAMLGERCFI